MKERDLAYLAGIIDSDGCIGMFKSRAGIQRIKNPRYVLTVTVVNTSQELMNWLVEKIGGTYTARKRSKKEHKLTFSWRYDNAKAALLLKDIRPYLIVKRQQADVGIELIDNWKTNHGRGATTSTEEIGRRDALWERMKFLNQTGVQPQRLNLPAPH